MFKKNFYCPNYYLFIGKKKKINSSVNYTVKRIPLTVYSKVTKKNNKNK